MAYSLKFVPTQTSEKMWNMPDLALSAAASLLFLWRTAGSPTTHHKRLGFMPGKGRGGHLSQDTERRKPRRSACGQLFWVMCQTLITYFTILDVKENPATSEQRLFCRVKICIPHSAFINNNGWIYSWSLNDLGWSADCQSPHRKNLSMTFDCPKT